MIPPQIAAYLIDYHSKRGVRILISARPSAVTGEGITPHAVVLEDGRTVETDLVIVGIGITPEVTLARDGGLAVQDGIVTDAFCLTSGSGIYAAGDAARFFHPLFGRSLRLEAWRHAAASAIRLAGHWARALAFSFLLAGAAWAAETLNIVFTCHAATTNSFWQAVKLGFDDGCAKVGAKGQFSFVQKDGSIEQQVANMEAVVARKPDALITSLVDNNAFVGVLKDAKEKGITIISSNVDATAGPELGLREAFIGQNFIPAGTTLGKRLAALFPKEGPIHVLVGVNAPGQNWAEQRAQGVMNGLEEFKKANPDRQVTIDKIDASTELAVVSDRVGAYLTAHPDTTAYFDMGYFHVAVAKLLKDRNVPPGKVLLGGFDLVPQVLEMMKAGYIQFEIDQQPYMQGFMPVMEAYLKKTVGLAPANIDTGEAVITPDQVDSIMALSKEGKR